MSKTAKTTPMDPTDQERRSKIVGMTKTSLIAMTVALTALIVLLVPHISAEQSSPTTTTSTAVATTTTTTTTIPPTTTTVYVPPAREVVNGLTYNLHDPYPALEAYELVAADIGWSAEKIHDWRRFANAIMRKESGYCPNIRRGGQWKNKGVGCVLRSQGEHDDAGFGQVTWQYFYAPEMPLCVNWNICSAEQIVSEPYISMLSLLRTIEESGSKPWCYTKAQIDHKNFGCRFAPDNPHYDPTDDVIDFTWDGA